MAGENYANKYASLPFEELLQGLENDALESL